MPRPAAKPKAAEAAGLELRILVQPRASREAVVGLHGDFLKIALTAPPVDGEANEALVRFLARLAGTSRGQVVIVAGLAGRRKRVRIEGLADWPEDWPEAWQQAAEGPVARREAG